MRDLLQFLYAHPAVSLALAALAGVLFATLAVRSLLFWCSEEAVTRAWAARAMAGPARLFFAGTAVLVVSVFVALPEESFLLVRRLAKVTMIVGATWAALRAASHIEVVVARRYPTDQPDNLRARRIHTRAVLLRRVLVGLIILVGASLVLMSFASVRRIGVSLFASAGVVGIVLGIAAKPVLENVLAGLQVAFTEPIRIDDVVIVGGEWGRIESIGMTYVTVRVWDERRLIVPLSRFIQEPFENWTRHRTDLIGSVYLNVDWSVPMEELREAVDRIVRTSPEWDGRFWNVQVTDAGERSLQVRVLLSASNAQDAWDLRVTVREKVVEWLQEHHPSSLPRLRTMVDAAAGVDDTSR